MYRCLPSTFKQRPSGAAQRAEWEGPVEPNRNQSIKLLSAVIAASAIVVTGVLAVALAQERTGTSVESMSQTVAQTVTQSAATTTAEPTKIPAPMAHPTLKAVRPRGF